MYDNEAAFSKSLCSRMHRDGRIDYTRIESHSTGNGIPDLYIMSGKQDYWVELKNSKSLGSDKTTIKVPWRPGQQAWFDTYRRHQILKCGVTLMSGTDCVFVIPMDRYYENNTVLFPWYISIDDFNSLRIRLFLQAACLEAPEFYKTYREAYDSMTDIWIGSKTKKLQDFDPDVAWENSFDIGNLMHGRPGIDAEYDEQTFNRNRWWLMLSALTQMNLI